MQSVLIFGRQPELGLAEIESLYGASKVEPIGKQAAIIDVDPCLLAFDRLGGSVKFAKLLTTLDTTNWKDIEDFLRKVAPGHAATMPEGKMRLGFSVIGLNISLGKLEASGLNLKKAIRKTGRSVRLVPNKTLELNSAQVLHNQLTGPTGWELVFIADGGKTVIAQTVKVQDIDAYTARDRQRPMRDARVGMLPPKLAQIILNLAGGELPEDKLSSVCDIPAGSRIPRPIFDLTVLDPFCGTGVVLQEALLMGYKVQGSDLEPRMIDYTRANLEWLEQEWDLTPVKPTLQPGDATSYKWKEKIDLVAAETYLGRPFTDKPSGEILAKTVSECNLILKKFLVNLATQIEPGTRVCLAVPAWQTRPSEFKRLPLIDQIADLGYNQVSFELLSQRGQQPLIYFRADQIVARELIVITKQGTRVY